MPERSRKDPERLVRQAPEHGADALQIAAAGESFRVRLGSYLNQPKQQRHSAVINRDGIHPSKHQGNTMEFANALNIATTLHAFDASAAYGRRSSDADRLHRGHVMLDTALLRQLRHARCMSQQDLANDCWRRNIPLSLTTIKRAELGRPVRFRIAREFARCFDVMVTRFVRAADAATACID